MYDIIDVTILALEQLGITPEEAEDELIFFTYKDWPCLCLKVSPHTLKAMVYLYNNEYGWESDDFCLEICNAASGYPEECAEHLHVAEDGFLFLVTHLTPYYGELPQRGIRLQLEHFLTEAIPYAKAYIEGIPALRNALGQCAHWGWTDPLERIRAMGCWTDIRQFSEGLVAVADRQGRYGFLDADGKQAIACRWAYAQPFSEGLAAVEDMSGRYGFIDRNGDVAIPCEWSGADWFSEGMAAVMDANGEWGFIDDEAYLVIPCEWAEVEDFHAGMARVYDHAGVPYTIDKYGRIAGYGENE